MSIRGRSFNSTLAIICLMTLVTVLWTADRAMAADRCFNSNFLKSECPHSNFEGAIPHPEWESTVTTKMTGFDNNLGTDGSQPNILVIYVDDMGWGDPGVYGGGTAVGAPTPNIDALAASGLRMTSAYSQPACTPTRAAWQTGRLPQRSGLTRPTAAGEENAGLATEVTIAKLLRDAGYMTGMAGKWHLGEAAGTWPTDVGYDEYYGNLSVNTAYHDWRDKNFSPELVFDRDRNAAIREILEIKTTVKSFDGDQDLATPSAGDPDTRYPDEIDLECDDVDITDTDLAADQYKGLDDSCEQNLEMQYLEWSIEFMNRAVGNNKPFFLYHAMNRVHTKNYPNPDFEGQSPASTPFRDGIIEIDYVVGKLLEAVQAIDDARDGNTFIFFTSDNGAEEDVHAGGINTSDSGHHPWRGAKGTTWEGGVRVSAIASWDGMIDPGRVSDGLFDHMDLFNTLARLGGVSLTTAFPDTGRPTDTYIDGVDQTSWLLATKPTWDPKNNDDPLNDPMQTSNREAVYYWYGQDFYGVRWAEFKRMERIMNVGMSVGPQTYGGLFNATKSETSDPSMGWFFNLYSDPKERMPITRTWAIGTLNELSMHSKTTFVEYPKAPHGVILNGYLLGGPAGGVVTRDSRRKLLKFLAGGTPLYNALPD